MNREYGVYRFISQKTNILSKSTLSVNKIKKRKFMFYRQLIIKCIYFGLFSNFSHSIYCLYDDKGLVHYSFLIPKCMKFSFMKRGDYQIGPCWTREDCRGKSIYSEMIKYIIYDKSKDKKNIRFYMLIRDTNYQSINGVYKLPFKKIGKCKKTRFLKLYKHIIIVN